MAWLGTSSRPYSNPPGGDQLSQPGQCRTIQRTARNTIIVESLADPEQLLVSCPRVTLNPSSPLARSKPLSEAARVASAISSSDPGPTPTAPPARNDLRFAAGSGAWQLDAGDRHDADPLIPL